MTICLLLISTDLRAQRNKCRDLDATAGSNLLSSLCLTIVVIICTICRISGLRLTGKKDSTWGIFWQFMAAALGLTMTAVTALRSLSYLTKSGGLKDRPLWYGEYTKRAKRL